MKGGPPPFVLAKFYFLCYLERHAQIKNHRQTPFGRKVSGRKERKRKKYACAKGCAHIPIAHALRVRRLAEKSKWKEERKKKKEKRKKKERIMPSLVATKSALAPTTFAPKEKEE